VSDGKGMWGSKNVQFNLNRENMRIPSFYSRVMSVFMQQALYVKGRERDGEEKIAGGLVGPKQRKASFTSRQLRPVSVEYLDEILDGVRVRR
jgi:hypothetical protein